MLGILKYLPKLLTIFRTFLAKCCIMFTDSKFIQPEKGEEHGTLVLGAKAPRGLEDLLKKPPLFSDVYRN